MSRIILREQRASKDRPCPACGHISPWCYFLAAGDGVWCGRADRIGAQLGRPLKAGWIHQLGDKTDRVIYTPPEKNLKPINWETHATRFRRAAQSDAVARLALSLGVSTASLYRLGIGWASSAALKKLDTGCKSNGAWSFPMRSLRDGTFSVVGIRLRSPEKKAFKYAVSGGDGSGLFIPDGLSIGSTLLLPEGPTSTAALLALGFDATGRPNCSAGIDNLRALCRRLKPAMILVVGDNDPADKQGRHPGQDGARSMVASLSGEFPVRSVLPPAPIKDVRGWLQLGATAETVSSHFGIMMSPSRRAS